jgi:hypothetical protein
MWEGGKRKGHAKFLNLLMFISGGHVTDEHMAVAPRVPCSLMFVGLTRNQ